MALTRIHVAPSEPDAATIAACRRGDRAALDAVFRAQAPALERLLARLVGSQADVEDLMQATLLAAIGAFPRFRGEASVRTWLARIAVRIVHEHLRRPAVRRPRVALHLLPAGAEPIDRTTPPDLLVDDRRRLARLGEHLRTLAPKKRIAFVLHVVEGRPMAEVAALVGASQVTTRSRVFWARRDLLARVRKDPALREWLAVLERTP